MKEQLLRLNYQRQKLRTLFCLFFLFPILCFSQVPCEKPEGNCILVVDEQNLPLPGALVETDRGKVFTTNSQGLCNVTAKYDSLRFSFIGFQDIWYWKEDIFMRLNTVTLQTDLNKLSEIVVHGRSLRNKDDLSQEITVLQSKDIARVSPSTTTDILEKNGTLFVQKSQFGGGSPIIRGFEANRILLVADNVRMNNAIYRSGHLQNSITVDPFLLDGVEVIFGPNSLLYGSDALGGVIHYISRKPKFQTDQPGAFRELNYGINLGSAGGEVGGHLDFNYGTTEVAFLTSLSLTDFGELRAGANRDDRYPDWGLRNIYAGEVTGEDAVLENSDPQLQIGTQYNQLDIAQKIAWRITPDMLMQVNLQYSTSSDIPRFDQLSEPGPQEGSLKWAEWYYGPQNRLLGAIELRHTKGNKLYDQASYIFSTQSIDEDRVTRRFGSPTKENQIVTVKLLSLTADFEKQIDSIPLIRKANKYFGNSKLNYGLDFKFNDVSSIAFEDTEGDSMRNFDILSRYPDHTAKLSAVSAYGTLTKNFLSDRLTADIGLRLGTESLRMQYLESDIIEWPDSYIEGISKTILVSSFSAGAVWRQTPSWRLRAVLSSAYRNPNIDDQAKIRVKGGEVSVPNLDLKPERSYNAEIGTQRDFILPYPFGKSKVYFSAYYSILKNAIVQNNVSLPNGDTIIVFEGDAQRTIANVNAENANIRGLAIGAETLIASQVKFSANFNYTRGQSKIEGDETFPRAHIPPVFGVIALDYERSKWTTRLDFRYNGKKDISRYAPDSSENPENATVDGTPGWTTLNLSASYELNDAVRLSGGVENIFDKHYRTFSSGVSAPGRNFFVRLRGTL